MIVVDTSILDVCMYVCQGSLIPIVLLGSNGINIPIRKSGFIERLSEPLKTMRVVVPLPSIVLYIRVYDQNYIILESPQQPKEKVLVKPSLLLQER